MTSIKGRLIAWPIDLWVWKAGAMPPPDRSAVQRAFARTVRRLRLRAGIAQERLALEVGIDRGYLGGLERGRHSPTLETIYKLLPGLGVTFPEFAAEFEAELKRVRRSPRA